MVVTADGAKRVWNAFEECFFRGHCILDYYHCTEYVREVADTLHAEGTSEAQEWAEAYLIEVCLGKVSRSIAALTLTNTRTNQQREAIEKLATYLENQIQRIHHLDDLDERFHIGSGAMGSFDRIES